MATQAASPSTSFALAALCALIFPAHAPAATLEGRILYPGRAIPAATVYARNLESTALHRAALQRNEATFRFELPAGRYWIFVRPEEPGLRELYGAHTRYSRCRQNPSPLVESCADHALQEVEIAPNAKRVALEIDDWFLEDTSAAALDAILGSATSAEDQAELGRPRFSEYRASAGAVAGELALDLPSQGPGAQYASELTSAAAKGANFAGSFALVRLPCGGGCEQVAVVDLAHGSVWFPKALAQVPATLPCRPDDRLAFREDSRLLEFTRLQGESVVTDYLLWDAERGALNPLAQYRRSAARFCGDKTPEEAAPAEDPPAPDTPAPDTPAPDTR
jgi:hypothetical protein